MIEIIILRGDDGKGYSAFLRRRPSVVAEGPSPALALIGLSGRMMELEPGGEVIKIIAGSA
jgi:hypothetical protein